MMSRASLLAAPRVCAIVTLIVAIAAPAFAQRRPAPPAQRPRNEISVRGFGTLGLVTFQASESFDATLDTHSGPVFGGGVQVLLPRGLFVQLGASRFRAEGERVFVGPGREVFPLDIPLEVTVTPVDLTGGWRYVHWRRVVPYGGAGYSWYAYRETSPFAEDDDEVNEQFGGFHVLGGAEYRALPWLAIGGEIAWSSVPDAIGAGGVSAVFGEDNLGGTTIRIKATFGR